MSCTCLVYFSRAALWEEAEMNDLKAMFGMAVLLFMVLVGAIIAPILVFAIKAGFLRVPVDREISLWSVILNGILMAGGFTLAVVVLSICWHWAVAAGNPRLEVEFSRYYANGCSACGVTAWWNMLSEAWPYFLATSVTLVARGWGDRARTFQSSRLLLHAIVIPPFVAGIAFLLFLYGAEILLVLQRFGFGDAALALVRRGIQELVSIIEPFVAIAKGQSFGSWLESEIARLHVSLFRLSALYPKVFWVFIFWGVISASWKLEAVE
jgi:hypothetical protein